ncbi:hypothetical protein Pcinc_014731 [Petrolisthes cinctipes]|uniref:Reverse transcriptase RNase H-like domain-containing protein n=1 Tax=Petrolisthes cinctipes TaxID=88211 RepID=A0AAE1KSZ2_PETCI|nr:hypothetical protein Pcinc_014731 [Petrolisthes cinctipes]
MPSDRTGFSAFDLLYGRSVRGPLTVLKDLWEDHNLQEEDRTSLQYIIELREKLSECALLAAQEADVSEPENISTPDKLSELNDPHDLVPCLSPPSIPNSETSSLPRVNQSLTWDERATLEDLTDASQHGLGAVLLQYFDGQPHPVAYASRKLLDRERKYSTIEREALAIVFGVAKFDYYLRGKEFILETDHKPLVYLKTSKCSNDRLMRWALRLQDYPFRVVHIAGRDNVGADLLSRSP